jgi:hypothetical protein
VLLLRVLLLIIIAAVIAFLLAFFVFTEESDAPAEPSPNARSPQFSVFSFQSEALIDPDS